MKIIEQSVELLWITPNAEQNIEKGGRVCYKSEDRITADSAKSFIEMVCKNNHESVIEHASASFRVVTDRAISHEICRHRLLSISQESTRYVSYSKEKHGAGSIQFLLPESLTEEQKTLFLAKYQADQDFYNTAIKSGCTPQQARDGLPLGLKTELVLTSNFREWKHIIKLRTSKAAHPKIRILTGMIKDILVQQCPSVFKDSSNGP